MILTPPIRCLRCGGARPTQRLRSPRRYAPRWRGVNQMLATAGKFMRDPADGKFFRDPADGKFLRNTDAISTCCCGEDEECEWGTQCPTTCAPDVNTPLKWDVTFADVLIHHECSDATECGTDPILSFEISGLSALEGTWTLTQNPAAPCVWVGNIPTSGIIYAEYSDDACMVETFSSQQINLSLQRTGTKIIVMAGMGSAAVDFFYAETTTAGCSTTETLDNEFTIADVGHFCEMIAHGYDGTCTITPCIP